MTILFVWVLFAVAVAVFAVNRGRSGLGWFLLSVLLSPLLGLLFVAVSKDLSKSAAPGQLDAQPRITCPACAEWVLPAAKVCKHCGAALTPVDDSKDRARQRALEAEARDSIKTIMGVVGIVALTFVAIALLK